MARSRSASPALALSAPADVLDCVVIARKSGIAAGEKALAERLVRRSRAGGRKAAAILDVAQRLNAVPQRIERVGRDLVPEKVAVAAKRLVDLAISRASQKDGFLKLGLITSVLSAADLMTRSEQIKVLDLARQPLPLAA
ncbi:MAG: hypothetical protein AAB865_01320 [Patescibacteria group bacterium]